MFTFGDPIKEVHAGYLCRKPITCITLYSLLTISSQTKQQQIAIALFWLKVCCIISCVRTLQALCVLSEPHLSSSSYAPCSKIAIAYIHACMGRTAYVGVNVLKVTMS